MVQRFNELEVPSTQRFSTGPEESLEIGRLQDGYFSNVATSLKLSRQALAAFFHVEHRVLCVERPGEVSVTDDFDASFWLSGVQPLASVRNVRDTPNFQIILFSKHSILPTTESLMQTILDADADRS